MKDLQSTRQMLEQARQGGYAVGAFNVENMEMVQAVVAAAVRMRAPVILQTTPGTLKYAAPDLFAGMAQASVWKTPACVALHLDHGDSVALCTDCIRAGYSSVMIDGSRLPFDENVELVTRAVRFACAVPVEAELGTVGGKEDGQEAQVAYTDPEQARVFVEKTGISSFAPAIGTAHGVYKATPRLDLERLSAIREAVSVPLVLHGTSGVPEDQVRECVRRGICKVNYATELRIAFSDGVKAYLAEKPDTFDPKKYLAAGRQAVEERVCALIRLLGSEGKA